MEFHLGILKSHSSHTSCDVVNYTPESWDPAMKLCISKEPDFELIRRFTQEFRCDSIYQFLVRVHLYEITLPAKLAHASVIYSSVGRHVSNLDETNNVSKQANPAQDDFRKVK